MLNPVAYQCTEAHSHSTVHRTGRFYCLIPAVCSLHHRCRSLQSCGLYWRDCVGHLWEYQDHHSQWLCKRVWGTGEITLTITCNKTANQRVDWCILMLKHSLENGYVGMASLNASMMMFGVKGLLILLFILATSDKYCVCVLWMGHMSHMHTTMHSHSKAEGYVMKNGKCILHMHIEEKLHWWTKAYQCTEAHSHSTVHRTGRFYCLIPAVCSLHHRCRSLQSCRLY